MFNQEYSHKHILACTHAVAFMSISIIWAEITGMAFSVGKRLAVT